MEPLTSASFIPLTSKYFNLYFLLDMNIRDNPFLCNTLTLGDREHPLGKVAINNGFLFCELFCNPVGKFTMSSTLTGDMGLTMVLPLRSNT